MLVSFILLLLFLVYPLFNVLKTSFFDNSGTNLTLKNYALFFEKKYYLSALKNSLFVCCLATIFATLIGVPMAYLITRFNIPCKRLFYVLIILSLLMPPFIGAYSWIILLGRNGLLVKALSKIGIHIPNIYGWRGIILVFTLQFYPHIFMYVQGALNTIDSSLEEAAESLGVSKFKRLMTITLPLVFPTLSAGALIVFLSAFSDFGTPMLIGEGFRVMPVLAYNEFINEMGGNAGVASTISVIMILVSTFLLLLQRYLITKKNYNMNSLRPPKVKKLSSCKRFAATLFCIVVVFLSVLPQAVVIISSFMKTKGPIFYRKFSLDNYKTIFYKVPRSITNTFTYSTVAILIMIFGGMLLSYVLVRKRTKVSALLDVLVMLPYVLPGTVFGIALIISFNKKPLILAGTWIILVISYVIRKLPYTIRSSTAILYQMDESLEEASINLGVSPLKTFWKITAPLMLTGTASGAVLSWVTTINELSSTIILYSGATATISVAVYSEVFTSNFGTGAALASILSFTTIISVLLVNKLTKGKGFNV
ncbi:iron ABC transporter permease [Clostridium ganghwense]|uniref:Iron ABC transporter permease n=2 Tax=Clostridium ganghwense TaxID=312089 RepID=A0ABT4CQM9_9CLOT|nr:iron ABC transporter permease [Clostridium ganghwense]MCY6371363.1 iron ABC transporter permease [Clostridium ganghwense]